MTRTRAYKDIDKEITTTDIMFPIPGWESLQDCLTISKLWLTIKCFNDLLPTYLVRNLTTSPTHIMLIQGKQQMDCWRYLLVSMAVIQSIKIIFFI